MVPTSIVIGALALAATAAITAPAPAGALAVRGGQTELINRPDIGLQHCWAEGGRSRFCEDGHRWN